MIISCYATDLIHVSNGLTDVDSNQLITPEFSVVEVGKRLKLHLDVDPQQTLDLWLNIYMLNELNHRLPTRLYSAVVDQHSEEVI